MSKYKPEPEKWEIRRNWQEFFIQQEDSDSAIHTVAVFGFEGDAKTAEAKAKFILRACQSYGPNQELIKEMFQALRTAKAQFAEFAERCPEVDYKKLSRQQEIANMCQASRLGVIESAIAKAEGRA